MRFWITFMIWGMMMTVTGAEVENANVNPSALGIKETKMSDWYANNTLARELCQLTEQEYRLLRQSDVLSVRPVVLPTKDLVVTANDYFMYPVTTRIDDTMVMIYDRCPCHWGNDKKLTDEHSGIRMIVTSSDGGATWTKPIDLLQAGKWKNSPFYGYGAALGVTNGVVYAFLQEGLYCSEDKGKTWRLTEKEPDFSALSDKPWTPGSRLTFDREHGLIAWTTCGYSEVQKERMEKQLYGTHLMAVYSPDYGKTWKSEKQPLPDDIRLSEISCIPFEGQLAFFLRNKVYNTRFAQGYSKTSWFPVDIRLSEIGPVKVVDTPDINYNPVTKRIEVAAPFRCGSYPKPSNNLKANLFSLSPDEFAAGKTEWRFDGTLMQYKNPWGKSDGFNLTCSVIDTARQQKIFHVWAGDVGGRAGIFQYAVSLDTEAVRTYLLDARGDGQHETKQAPAPIVPTEKIPGK